MHFLINIDLQYNPTMIVQQRIKFTKSHYSSLAHNAKIIGTAARQDAHTDRNRCIAHGHLG